VARSSTLAKVFSKGKSTSSANVVAMDAVMQASYVALPKNRHGLLSRNAAAYLVHKYAMHVYHYTIRGLGPDPAGPGTNRSDHLSNRQRTSAPETLQSLIENGQAGHGYALREAASLALMMHELVTDQDSALMNQAFDILVNENMIPPNEEEFSVPDVVKVIQAWQWLHMHYFDTEKDLFFDHMSVPVHRMYEFGKLATCLMEAKFYRERHIRNPFKAKTLSTAETVQLAHKATEEMGTWQDDDCKAMKRYLIKLDPDGNGRVLLDTVYDQPESDDEHGEQIFRFSESQDYLRSVGALDESDPSHPQVLISNYLLGPANCYKAVAFHTFCCLNECDAVLTEVERAIGGPSAAPDELLPLLGNLTTTSMNEPPPLATSLVDRLSSVAAQNGGMVPLHGRLFAQWLHFAFPHECPYPHITKKDGEGNSLTTSYFQGAADAMASWTDEEMLPLIEEEHEEHGMSLGFRGLLRAVFMLFAAGAMCNQVRVLVVTHARKLKQDMVGSDVEKCV